MSPLAPPEGLFSSMHTIRTILHGDPNRTLTPIRYRYPEIDFRNLKPGDSVQVLAQPGWAGYTLRRVTGTHCADLSPHNSSIRFGLGRFTRTSAHRFNFRSAATVLDSVSLQEKLHTLR